MNITNAPVVTTLNARGIVSDEDPHNLGMIGMHGSIAGTGADAELGSAHRYRFALLGPA